MEQSENVYIPNLEGLTPPRTAHVFINLSTDKYSKKFLVKALHDSGCAKTVISKRCFDKYIEIGQDLPLKKEANVSIVSCTNNEKEVYGITTLLVRTPYEPEYEFTTTDKIKHEIWVITGTNVTVIQNYFNEMDSLYIADGHHRSASSAGLRRLLSEKRKNHFDNENFFLSFIMDERKMQILEFNRLVKTLNNLSKEEFLGKLEEIGVLSKLERAQKPTHEHQITFYVESNWFALDIDKGLIPTDDVVKCLDTDLLTELILKPILGINDLKTDENISFISGAESIENIVASVDSTKNKIAFILYPISIEQVKAVADANGIMPPKSTWVEPKLRSGLTIYTINELFFTRKS
jgi:uncharacterized protein (DUF1015 family)